MEHRYQGIEGLGDAISYSAIVSVGRKGPRGNPIDTNRFYILGVGMEEIAAGKGMRGLAHQLDPRFEKFNGLKSDDPKASVLRGTLVFARLEEDFTHHLLARSLGQGQGRPPGGGVWGMPPGGLPACVGDGTKASRFTGLDDKGQAVYEEITCPNDLCYFRQGTPKACKAFGRIYFNLRWPDGNPLETPLVRYQSHGWPTVKSMKAMFATVDKVAEGLGLEPGTWGYTGLPFTMTLGTKKVPEKGHSFPVVTFGVDDLRGFFLGQAQIREQLAQARPVRLIAAGAEHDDDSMEGLARIVDSITPGNIPATKA